MERQGIEHVISTRLVDPALALFRKGHTRRDVVPILMYHSITEEAEPGVRGYYRLNTSPSLFRDHLQLIKDEGYCAKGLDAAWSDQGMPNNRAGAGDSAGPQVVLTFDDGYQDFLTHAWPALAGFGFSATVFLPTAFIGDRRSAFKGRPCLTWAEVRELHSCGVEFGSHTVNHPKLWELGESELKAELHESRCTIEDNLGAAVSTFAHPYAFPLQDRAYVNRFRSAMDSAGYSLGVTTSLGSAGLKDDPWILKRLPANGADDVRLLRAKLHGAYDWLALPQRAFKAAKGWLRPDPSGVA